MTGLLRPVETMSLMEETHNVVRLKQMSSKIYTMPIQIMKQFTKMKKVLMIFDSAKKSELKKVNFCGHSNGCETRG